MKVTSVNVGRSRALVVGARSVASAIGKHTVTGRVAVRPVGLAGDEQADLSVHGGLAVSEPRLPCFKFNAAMGFAQASTLMGQSGWCGYYLAVREAGTIEAGQAFTVDPGPREVRIDALFRARMPGVRVSP